MKNNYYSLTTRFFSFGTGHFINDVASACQDKGKASCSNLFSIFLLLMALSAGQHATAKNTANSIFTAQKFIVDHLLLAAIAEGRGGGGGHGHAEWLYRHRHKNNVHRNSKSLKLITNHYFI